MPAGVAIAGWGWRHAGRLAWAIRDLDLIIEPGERVLLLGESGAGKSTLLKALAGVLADDEGEREGIMLVAGQRPAPGNCGLVLQDPDSQLILARVGDDAAFGCENLGVPRDETWRRVHEALELVGLDLPLDRSTSALSGGQKQRLALAGVLAMRPGLILLDEPTANLDPTGVTEVRDAVTRVARSTGATLVVIEHRVAVWQNVVDRVVVLGAGGGALADGPPDMVLETRGAELAASGVWVAGHPPVRPARHPRVGLQARPDAPPLIQTRALAVGRAKIAVQTDLEIRADSGSTLAVTGPNGSGKSTLGLTLAGLLPPLQGEVVAGPALAGTAGRHPIHWRSRELLTRIGTVFQQPEHQFIQTTVRAELEVGPLALGLSSRETADRVTALLARLRLDRLAQANPFTLSGGEKRRLSVATVLATRPKVLVLDEPTFGQDSRTWSELVALLAGLVDDGTAIVAITHDLDLVDALADVRIELS